MAADGRKRTDRGRILRELVQKLRHVYVPFLAVTASFVVGYSVLAWALVYRTRLVVLDEGPRSCGAAASRTALRTCW